MGKPLCIMGEASRWVRGFGEALHQHPAVRVLCNIEPQLAQDDHFRCAGGK